MSSRPQSNEPRPPMGAPERQAAVDELRRQVRALTADRARLNRIRSSVYACENLVDAIAREVTDPKLAQDALDALGTIISALWDESEVAP